MNHKHKAGSLSVRLFVLHAMKFLDRQIWAMEAQS